MSLAELFRKLDRYCGGRWQTVWKTQIDKENTYQVGMPDYFENVWLDYRVPVDVDQHSVAIDRGLSAFEMYRASAPDFDSQHKGSPLYVMGYSAFASHDYPSASLFFDAAVAEDLRRWGPAADKPALLFMSLENRNQHVLASDFLEDVIATFQFLIDDYNSRQPRNALTLDDLRNVFLKPTIASQEEHKRALVTALISFAAEWKYKSRLIGLVKKGSREPFFLHLFRGCLLFESLLKESVRNPRTNSKETLKPAIQRLFKELGVLHNLPTGAEYFDAEVLTHVSPGLSIEKAIELTGKTRNTIGHNLAWETPSLDKQKYDDLVKLIATSCFHAISTVHR